jgi:ribosomal protein S12 methylthiotransferase
MRFERLGCFQYSHEEDTKAYELDDNVPAEVKQQRANEIMEVQSQISWELNQQKVGHVMKVMIDRKEGNYYIGRSEYDSPDVDNLVHISNVQSYLSPGTFVDVLIEEATDYDLYGILRA